MSSASMATAVCACNCAGGTAARTEAKQIAATLRHSLVLSLIVRSSWIDFCAGRGCGPCATGPPACWAGFCIVQADLQCPAVMPVRSRAAVCEATRASDHARRFLVGRQPAVRRKLVDEVRQVARQLTQDVVL